jgi:hypothetical protein
VTRVLKTEIVRVEEDGLFLLWGGSIGVFARSGGLFAAREQLSSRSQRKPRQNLVSQTASAMLGADPGQKVHGPPRLGMLSDWLFATTAIAAGPESVEVLRLDEGMGEKHAECVRTIEGLRMHDAGFTGQLSSILGMPCLQLYRSLDWAR